MTRKELEKLEKIVAQKFYGQNYDPDKPYYAASRHVQKSLSVSEYEEKQKSWANFCEKMGIRRMSSMMSIICNESESTDIRIVDPIGCVLIFTEEEANKILVLGL
jgi:hypothetical protein